MKLLRGVDIIENNQSCVINAGYILCTNKTTEHKYDTQFSNDSIANNSKENSYIDWNETKLLLENICKKDSSEIAYFIL